MNRYRLPISSACFLRFGFAGVVFDRRLCASACALVALVAVWAVQGARAAESDPASDKPLAEPAQTDPRQSALDLETKPPPPGERVVVSRALLSVGSDVYTAREADLIITLWNVLAEPAVERATDFDRLSSFPNPGQLSGFEKIMAYPDDVRRLMYILFVWTEARRLNLFVSGEKALSDARGVLDASGFPRQSSSRLQTFWNQMGQSDRLLYTDMVLRARAYLRIRGDFEANRRLTESIWYWHNLSQK